MYYLGLISFALAFVTALAGLVVAALSLARREKQLPGLAVRLTQVSFGLHTLSIVAMLILQALEDFTVSYVNSVINPAMSPILRITALWGGQAGSLFFWSWIIALCFFLAVSGRRGLMDAWAYVVAAVNLLFFIGLPLFLENPFARVWELVDGTLAEGVFAPAVGAVIYRGLTGVGLNPLLRHPGMIIHPPILYMGFGLFLIPFAVGVSQLIRRQNDDDLLDKTHAWLIAAWVLLSAGIVLGSWWSYDVLGWGGYWAWDPVETASLLPWLTSTGLLHSLLLQRKRGIFRRFNLVLVLASYLLVIFSIFITRAGVLSSVHAFSESLISRPLIVFTILMVVFSIALLVRSWKSLGSGWELNSLISREALFLYTNVLLLGLTVVCLWGLVYPLTSGTLGGQQITLDRGFYDRSTLPLFILLVVLMGICPLIGWSTASLKRLKKTWWIPVAIALAGVGAFYLAGIRAWSALVMFFIVFLGLAVQLFLTARDANAVGPAKFFKFWWKQRGRYGAFLVHAGILLIALGIAGTEVMGSAIEGTLIPGDRMPLGRYEIELNAASANYDNPEYMNVVIETTLYRDGEKIADLKPGQHIYMDRNQSITIPAVHSTLRGDVYALVLGFNMDMPYATIKLIDNPLVNWMWIGGFCLVLGGILAGTARRPDRETDEDETAADSKVISYAQAAGRRENGD